MVFPLLPLTAPLGTVVKFFREISSSLWDSKVVEDEELVSPEGLYDSFLDRVSLDRHPVFPLSDGEDNTGTVRLLSTGTGLSATFDVERSILGC
jgi:hypothetical protein